MWIHLLALFCFVLRDVATHVPVADVPLRFSLDSEIVHPVRVDEQGSFLTFDLSPRIIKKRGISPHSAPPAYYAIKYQGVELIFNLTQNHQLLSPGYVSEWHNGGIREARIRTWTPSYCHMRGEVQDQNHFMGKAAVSICSGLRGVFQLAQEDFLIEPMETSPSSGESMPHRIYRRHLEEFKTEGPTGYKQCGVREHPNSQNKWEKRRERWEHSQLRNNQTRRIRPRSISKEKWVETLVVADQKMVEYHGRNHVENYVLTIMNMVAGLFHDASIGNRINIVIVRLILLESEEEELKITHHADNTLRSFCKWQKSLNMKGEEHPLHHDVAVLLTRRDICAAMNRPCETLGLSHVSGMCQPHRSCNINEDTGLPTAFTVTHELGHSFGVQHDGSGNECQPKGKRPHIMSPQLVYDTAPLTWSRCSRDYITRFLDRGWGLCLDDPPSKELLNFPSVPPGVLYDVGHQCRLQYGSTSSYCLDIDNVCNTLWCSVGSTCHSKLDAAVDGTTCGENKWCFSGDCVPVGHRPTPVDGMWSSWSSWSSCTRTCGAGIQSAERHCSNPTPRYGGRYCLGERKRYRLCNIVPCPRNTTSFRQQQCSHFDSVPYKGKLYHWSPVPNNINPCELHCRADKEHFAEKLLDAVIDGTPCYEDNSRRDMCINGICKNIGCDFEIDSNAVEDRCGVCLGDSSSCHTVHKMFEDSDGLGYVDIGLIPPGAHEIHIEEVAEAENFLALRSEDPEKYFLNGKWTIQWNGDYRAAGTTFTYTRTGNLENLTAPGPTYEPVWIQLLFQEKNPGVRYQYTIRRDPDNSNEIQPPDFSWRFGSWTECSATCGTGVQRQLVHCVEKVVGLVEERYCDFLTRPDDRHRTCNEEACPPRWWVGEWQQCSITCGINGVQKRTVLCIQRVGLDEQRALQPVDCVHLPKPEASMPCKYPTPCRATWHQGNWSECSVSCGEGVQYREVYCSNDVEGNVCDHSDRPVSKRACVLSSCPFDSFSRIDWTGSGGSSKENFNEIFPGQPRTFPNNQLPPEDNSISEGDFSSVGEGGQRKGGRAFVDDFYYDYNFINFHEDLDYDPLNNNDIDGIGDVGWRGEEHPTQIPEVEVSEKQDEEQKKEIIHFTTTTVKLATKEMDISVSSKYFQISNIHSKTNSYVSKEEDQSGSSKRDNNNNLNHQVENTSDELHTSPPSKGIQNTSFYQKPHDASVNLPEESLTHLIINPLQGGTQEPTYVTTDLSKVAQDLSKNPPSYLPNPTEVTTYSSPYSSFDPLPVTAQDISQYPTSTPWPVMDSSQFPLYGTDPVQDIMQDPTTYPLKALNVNPAPGHVQNEQLSSNNNLTNPMQNISSASEDFVLFDLSADYVPHVTSKNMPTEATLPWDPWVSQLGDSMRPPSSESAFTREPELDHTVFTALHITSLPSTEAALFPVNSNDSDKSISFDMLNTQNSNDGNSLFVTPAPSVAIHTTSLSSVGNSYLWKGYWEVGNWSECSTSCGLGAKWRPVWCSGDSNNTCDPSAKPPPAHRCFLRPCASWSVGTWSKCSHNCGTGVKMRDVHCVNIRDKRILRPFHCQTVASKPRTQIPCKEHQCMEWNVSSWTECSEECGEGTQEREVSCPESGSCNDNLKPGSRRTCNDHPCTTWTVAPWSRCTALCGGGIQERQVKCLNTRTRLTEEDSSLCDHLPRPDNTQKCNLQECPLPQNISCSGDRIALPFCQALMNLDRCSLPMVQTLCCKTCQSHLLGPREHGKQQLSRR
ncbi:A disintegrin and metalloproteinase with thrombospondin motifs 7-like isoform X1 [Pelobates fuscus]|uniref:A disintegrin and metalloproteinase with thrombospondin motifs 7-like isoform X1 n=2 Tax=Pelobates fuscus TaxID=191477 RepID=UPI002FE47A7B